jgi:UDP-N-acetylmuramyl pentapeptide phosphotransferase/UDP-N-acetylglucosamine-1-phosphate transferase
VGGLGVAEVVGFEVPWLAVAAALVLAGIGFVDDGADLAPALRLGAQVVGGGVVGLAFGGIGWIAFGAICLPVLVNAVNFMDGINGITGLNMAAWGGVAMVVGSTNGAPALVAVGAAAAGSSLGFLPWNAPKAQLFLGDVGSYLFGAMVAIGIVASVSSEPITLILVAPLAIYLADTGTALVRRAVRRESLMVAHREHVYQRLVNDAGFSHVSVASGTVILSLAITAAWIPGSIPLGVSVTIVIVAGYLASPALLRRAGVRATRTSGGLHQ